MIEEAAKDRFPNSELCRIGFEAGASWMLEKLKTPIVNTVDHHKRAADMLETLRDTIGYGYGEGDIEHITKIIVARLKEWDRLSWDGVGVSYILTEPLVAAVEATKGRIVTIDVLRQLHRQLNREKQVKK